MSAEKKSHISSRLLAAFAFVLFAVASWVLWGEIRAVGLSSIVTQFTAIPVLYLVGASLFTAISYFVLTYYDALAFRYIGVKKSYRYIAPISFSAFAVGHNLGIASLSGGAIRYRAYSLIGLSITQIAQVIVFISITFGLGVAVMLGIVLLTQSTSLAAVVAFDATWARELGFAMLMLVSVYLLLLKFYKNPIQIRSWIFNLPSLRIGIAQIVLACADMIAASIVLFILLKTSIDISYSVLLTAFLLSIVIGAISTVPGAIGVFESAMVLLLPEIPADILLGAVLAYRLIYYVLPLLMAVSLIAVREAVEQKLRLKKISDLSMDWGTRIVPQSLGAAVFLAGAFLLVRGAIPIGFDQTKLIEIAIPLQLLEMSHLLGSALGAGLLIVARGLYRRLHRAWIATIAMLIVAVIAAFVQSQGLVHVAFLSLLILVLWVSRAEFYRGKSLLDQDFDSGWIVSIALVLIASLGIGMLAYQNTTYSNELWWQFTLNGQVSRMLRALLLAFVLLGMFAIARLLRGGNVVAEKSAPADIATIKNLISMSDSAGANIALLGDKRFMIHPSGEAFIMYQKSGGSWIALGDPVGNQNHFEELLWQYREACDANNSRCAFYQVSIKYLSIYIDLGMSFLKLGEEGVVDLTQFGLEGSHRADLRQAVSKAKRNGAEFSVIPASEMGPVIDRLAEISSDWLEDKGAEEKGFSLGFFDKDYVANFDCAVVTVEGQIVAFANLWKGGTGIELSLDLMRYSDKAPKGVMDYLFTEVMLWGKANGFRKFGLGMAPLSGLETRELATPWHKLGNLVYRFGENFYNFEGLRNYKEKFEPQWEPRFLACRGGLQVPSVLLDTTVLISGGFAGILTK